MATTLSHAPAMRPALLRLAVAMMALLLTAACEPTSATAPSRAGDAPFSQHFPLTLAGRTIRARIALTSIETTRGFMGTIPPKENEAIVFVFAASQPREFWMRNVPFNLDLGYFTADGRLDEVRLLVAENPTPVPSRSNAVRYVVELPEGWFERNDAAPGAMLDLTALRAAVKARGFDDTQYIPPPRPKTR